MIVGFVVKKFPNLINYGCGVHKQNSLTKWVGMLVILLAGAVILMGRLRFGQGALAFYDDDFFYYAQIARNLAYHGISSFDGSHLTNGYHPLWLLILTILLKAFPGKFFLYEVQIFSLACVVGVYLTTRRCLLLFSDDVTVVTFCSVLLAFFAAILSRGGMEVTLMLPLVFMLLWFRLRIGFNWTKGQMVGLGFLSSLVILSRLDSAILVALLFICDTVTQRFRKFVPNLLFFMIGSLPLLAYLAFSYKHFHMFMPASAQAKELRFHHYPVLTLFSSLFSRSASNMVFVLSACISEFGATALLLRNKDKSYCKTVPVFWAIVLFPVIYFSAISVLSDWPIFFWYYYPFILSVFAFLCLWFISRPRGVLWKAQSLYYFCGIVAVFSLVTLFYLARFTFADAFSPNINDNYVAVLDIAKFASTHSGVYAMGDRAGITGWLIPDPVIQLEGLVMDKPFINLIRRQTDLSQVLDEYNVRYYIATNPRREGKCYFVDEPSEAGPDSAHMHGEICKTPLAMFHHHIETVIFDMGKTYMH